MDLEGFVRASRQANWLEDQAGFLMDIDHALWEEQASFKHAFERIDQGEQLVLAIEWIGGGDSISDIDRDFYRVCGRIAEPALFVSQAVETDHIRYELLTGYEEHGHIAIFKVTGEKVAAIARDFVERRSQGR